MSTRSRQLLLASALTGGLLAPGVVLASVASAHTHVESSSCDASRDKGAETQLDASGHDYPSGSHILVIADGATIKDAGFTPGYEVHTTYDGAKAHHFAITVTSPDDSDGSKGFSFSWTKDVAACVTTPTPTPTTPSPTPTIPSPTPTETTPAPIPVPVTGTATADCHAITARSDDAAAVATAHLGEKDYPPQAIGADHVATFPVPAHTVALSGTVSFTSPGKVAIEVPVSVPVCPATPSTPPATTQPPVLPPAPTSSAPAPLPLPSVTTPPAKPSTRPGTVAPKPVLYQDCAAVRTAGKAPLLRGQLGYRDALDSDHDGVACEAVAAPAPPAASPRTGDLAYTGASNVGVISLAGIVALAGGGLLAYAARRRRDEGDLTE